MVALASVITSSEPLLVSLSAVAVLGIGAQWLSWRLKSPSILLLLILGFLAGNTTSLGFERNLVDPDILLGPLLFPVVSLSVAIILFEGGLSLRLTELREVGGVVGRLVSVGAIVTWVIAGVAAWRILGFRPPLAALFGAILIVTGPTVIQPLLEHVRPSGPSGSILKWEGIVIDPIGAMVTVLVFEAILLGQAGSAGRLAVFGVLRTLIFGTLLGVAAAWLIRLVLSRYWVPDYLENPVALLMLTAAFTAANTLQAESGLLTAPVMGLILANQRRVAVRHIVEFNENLRVLLLAGLFIVLGARVTAESMLQIGWRSVVFLLILIFVARPLAVLVSTVGSQMDWAQRALLSWMAPRGVVAAAVASIFAIRLIEARDAGLTNALNAERLVPEVFFVILATVAIYGLTARPLALLLRVARKRREGLLFVGAYTWVREIATALQAAGHRVLVVDTNAENLAAAREAGLPTALVNVLEHEVEDQLELESIGRLLACTSNEELNALSAVKFAHLFGRQEVYQLPPESQESAGYHLRGRLLFGPRATFTSITLKFAGGAEVVTTPITRAMTYQRFQEAYDDAAIPLFLLTETGEVVVYTDEASITPRPGQTLISLVPGKRTSDADQVPTVQEDR